MLLNLQQFYLKIPKLKVMININKEFHISGYSLESDTFKKIYNFSKEIMQSNKGEEKFPEIIVDTEDNHSHNFKSFNEYEDSFANEAIKIKELTVKCSSIDQKYLNIHFHSDGYISLKLESLPNESQQILDKLISELNRLDPNFNFIIRFIFFSKRAESILLTLFSFISLVILYNVVYYIYASNVGINLKDPSLIPKGNEYYREVEDALKSDSLYTKIDILLKGELKNFTNVEIILDERINYIKFSLIFLVIIVIIYFIIKSVKKLYPKSFFAISPYQTKLLTSILRKRDIWNIGVFLALIINIVAGLVLVLLN